jgi:hypothetical protein
MGIEARILEVLSSSQGLTAKVGNNITPNFVYQETLFPFVVFTITNSSLDDEDLTGGGAQRVEFTVDCYHSTLAGVVDLVDLVVEAFRPGAYHHVSTGPVDLIDDTPGMHQATMFYVFNLE